MKTAEGVAVADRDLILFTAFSVVLVTLALQGLTLNPMIRRLSLHDDGLVEREPRPTTDSAGRAP